MIVYKMASIMQDGGSETGAKSEVNGEVRECSMKCKA